VQDGLLERPGDGFGVKITVNSGELKLIPLGATTTRFTGEPSTTIETRDAGGKYVKPCASKKPKEDTSRLNKGFLATVHSRLVPGSDRDKWYPLDKYFICPLAGFDHSNKAFSMATGRFSPPKEMVAHSFINGEIHAYCSELKRPLDGDVTFGLFRALPGGKLEKYPLAKAVVHFEAIQGKNRASVMRPLSK